MFADYFIKTVAAGLVGYFFLAMLGFELLWYLVAFLILAAAFAMLVTILIRLNDLEKKLDDLAEQRSEQKAE